MGKTEEVLGDEEGGAAEESDGEVDGLFDESHRITPLPSHPVFLSAERGCYRAIDVSAGG